MAIVAAAARVTVRMTGYTLESSIKTKVEKKMYRVIKATMFVKLTQDSVMQKW